MIGGIEMFALINGEIVDGNNMRSFNGSILIEGDSIKGIMKDSYPAQWMKDDGIEKIDVNGRIICPGFIDIHTHSDICNFVYRTPNARINQGVTTEIIGNCGISAFPFGEHHFIEIKNYFNKATQAGFGNLDIQWRNLKEYKLHLDDIPMLNNIGALIGHGILRANVMGFSDRIPTEEEISMMCDILETELRNGAFGMSLGLIYYPGSYSRTEELIALGKIIKKHDKVLAAHVRDESSDVISGVKEFIEIGRQSGVHLHISHIKLLGKRQWGNVEELMGIIEEAREDGLIITMDQYPYTATATRLSAVIPKWATVGGDKTMLERLKDPTQELLRDIQLNIENRGGADAIEIVGTQGVFKEFEGKRLLDISKILNMTAPEATCYLLFKSNAAVAAIYFSLDEEDLLYFMRREDIAVASDGYNYSLDSNETKINPHPRNFGTFPKSLEIIRNKGLMNLETAVYKMTGLPAKIFGIEDRGTLTVGNKADIVVFNKDTIADKSTYQSSLVKPDGIEYVIINGQKVIAKGDETGVRPGVFIDRW